MSRSYRVIVRGRFVDLTDAQRASLRADQAAHGMFAARFTPDGTFLYAPELVNYELRYLLTSDEASPADADLMAELDAEQRAEAGILERGLQGRVTGISSTCVEDVKFRKGRTA